MILAVKQLSLNKRNTIIGKFGENSLNITKDASFLQNKLSKKISSTCRKQLIAWIIKQPEIINKFKIVEGQM